MLHEDTKRRIPSNNGSDNKVKQSNIHISRDLVINRINTNTSSRSSLIPRHSELSSEASDVIDDLKVTVSRAKNGLTMRAVRELLTAISSGMDVCRMAYNNQVTTTEFTDRYLSLKIVYKRLVQRFDELDNGLNVDTDTIEVLVSLSQMCAESQQSLLKTLQDGS